jgi:hypothetical protein
MLRNFVAVKASNQTSLPAAAAAAVVVVVVVVVQLMASLVCQAAMFVIRNGPEVDYARSLSTFVAESFLEIRLDCAYPGDLRTSVGLTVSLRWADDEAFEEVASIAADAERAKAGAVQALAKGFVQSGGGP